MSGGGGKKNVTTTTTSEPPAYLQPALQGAASAAQGQYNTAGGQQLTDQAQDLTSQTLSGNFLSPDTNPYLRDTFNRAADLTQTRLSSEFAGQGRDLGAALPARSEELQSLAAQIYGGNYMNERNYQNNAVSQSQQLDPLNRYINQINALVPGAGGQTTTGQQYFKTGLI